MRRDLRVAWAFVLLAALLVTGHAHAQVYRWVDADGVVHYGDKPPADQDAEALPIRSAPTDLEATLREQVERERRLELADQLRADAAEDAAAEAEYEARLARSCEQARRRVATIESEPRLWRVDDSGNRYVYNESERAAALAEAQAQVRDWCR